MQVEGGDPLIVVLHEPEGLEGEARLLGRAVQLHPGLIVTCTPGRVNKRSVSQNAEPGGYWGCLRDQRTHPPNKKVIVGARHRIRTCRGEASVQQHVEPSKYKSFFF